MAEANYVPDPRGEQALFTVLPGGDLGGGSGGSVQIYTGASPPAAPSNPNGAAIFYPAGGGPLQQWDTASQTWV